VIFRVNTRYSINRTPHYCLSTAQRSNLTQQLFIEHQPIHSANFLLKICKYNLSDLNVYFNVSDKYAHLRS